MSNEEFNRFINKRRDTRYNIDSAGSLLEKLNIKDKELTLAIETGRPQSAIDKLEGEVTQIRKEIEDTLDRFNIDTEIVPLLRKERDNSFILRENLTNFRENRDKFLNYRETANANTPQNSPTDKSENKDTTIIAPVIAREFQLNQPIFELPKEIEKTPGCFDCQTPLTGTQDLRKEVLIREAEKFEPFTPENAVNKIKQHLSKEIKKEFLETYFEKEENVNELQQSVKKGFGFFKIINAFREKLNIFAKKEEDLLEKPREKVEGIEENREDFVKREATTKIGEEFKHSTPIGTGARKKEIRIASQRYYDIEKNNEDEAAGNIKPHAHEEKEAWRKESEIVQQKIFSTGIIEENDEDNSEGGSDTRSLLKLDNLRDKTIQRNREENNTENTMNRQVIQIRGLSLKDALDLIPRYNGQNIPLAQFIDGCLEAQSIIPQEAEPELAKLIRIRLYGEALSAIRGQTFNCTSEIIDFFEEIFGSARTYHDWTGELAKTKQKNSEPVIVYLNRLREVENEIYKAAKRERRVTQNFRAELEKDCVKYFLKGLRWEIRVRMGRPETWREAREQAIEIEREYAGSTVPDEELRGKEDFRQRNIKEARKITYVSNEMESLVCAHCKRTGHGAINCLTLARQYALERMNERTQRIFENRPLQNKTNIETLRNNNGRNFGGWNAENQPRTEFLPGRNFNNNVRNDIGNGENSRSNNRRYEGNNFARESNNRMQFGNQNLRGNSASNERPQIPSCFYCGKIGHIQRNCFKYQNDAREKQIRSENTGNLSRTGAPGEMSHGQCPVPSREGSGGPSQASKQ